MCPRAETAMPPESQPTAPLPLTDERWAALAERDRHHDGAFVYAVVTTGIYCRPSCPARTPKRGNVRLFPDPESAEARGFRACRRCRPQAERSTTEEKVARARELLEERLQADPEDRPTLAQLAEAVGWSPGHLQRAFTRIVGLSPKDYADARRLERAKEALRDGDTVLEATFEAGFGSGKALYERSDDAFGMTPGTYRRGGEGLEIRYALFDSALGAVLVAATDEGICAVALGDDAEELVDGLREDFHAAEIARDDEGLGPWAEPVLRYLAGAPEGSMPEAARALLELPVDARGTAFQHRVWSALRQIPVGESRSYSEVAEALGQPKAARAVARACATNPVALVVPCHRVVGADGALRGYRWGTERKRELLELEAGGAEPEAAC